TALRFHSRSWRDSQSSSRRDLMRGSSIARGTVIAFEIAVVLSGSMVAAQAPKADTAKAPLPRTPDGRPDLQGVFDYATATPLERPAAYANKLVLTEAEAAEFLRQQATNRNRIDDAPPAG